MSDFTPPTISRTAKDVVQIDVHLTYRPHSPVAPTPGTTEKPRYEGSIVASYVDQSGADMQPDTRNLFNGDRTATEKSRFIAFLDRIYTAVMAKIT